MCGIVAATGTLKVSVDKIKLLLAYNEHRGKDSIGYYNEIEDIPFEKRVYKKMGQASDVFIPEHTWKESNLFLGHLRAATKGVVNLENCHPFNYGDIIGCHNGTLTNWELLKLEHQLDDNIEMDSKIFFDYLSKNDDYKILEEFSGAANVLWVDKKQPRKLFIFKHKERTLFRGQINNEEGKIMYISSVEKGLKAIGCTNIKAFKDQYLYEIVDGLIVKTTKIASNPRTKISEERRKELKLNTPTSLSVVKDNNFVSDVEPAAMKSNYISNYQAGDKWETVKFADESEFYFPVKLGDDFHPKVAHREIIWQDSIQAYFYQIYLDSGAYYEVRLGIPDYHFCKDTGENLKPLFAEEDNLSIDVIESMISTGDLIQEISIELQGAKKQINELTGINSIAYQHVNDITEKVEKKCDEIEEILTLIIKENVDTEIEAS